MNVQFLNDGPISGILNVPKGVTALVGGGGKTTLLFRLANELSAEGARVIVTTTTHIWPPDTMPVLLDPQERDIAGALEKGSPIAVGTLAPDGKLSPCGISAERLSALADYVLIEADGSKRLPLKAPAAHEPVIPGCTRLVLAVAGLDGLGEPMVKTVFRPALYAALLGKTDLSAPVLPKDAAAVLVHPDGQRKSVPAGARFVIVLNKADDEQRRALAEEIAGVIPPELAEAVYSTYLKE